MPALAATIINAGATSRRVMWRGTGHGASIYSPCALPPILGYLERCHPADRHVLSRLTRGCLLPRLTG